MGKNKSEQEVNLFKKGELRNHIILINTKDERVFGNVEGGGIFHDEEYPWVLKDEYVDKNLFAEIRDDAKKYFKDNGIKWWEEKDTVGEAVPGHTLSSQIACLNHLFRFKNDEKAVLAVINGIKNEYDKVLAIPYDDEKDKGYIAFEVVSNNDYLREDPYNKGLTRGSMCTSIDALIYAHHEPTDKNHIILIEWKYTESYDDEDKTCNIRMHRYNDKIFDSKYIEKPNDNKYEGSVYYHELFYQLMRQTLWAEQVIKHRPSNPRAKKKEPIEAKDYLHIHVISKGNTALLNKGFKEEGDNLMAETWKKCFNDEGKKRYIIIDPEELLKPIAEDRDLSETYSELLKYLRTRYWHKAEKKGKE